MKLKQTIKEYNIQDVREISEKDHIGLAKIVSSKITSKFGFIDYLYIYNKMLDAKIYIVKIPEDITKAIYVYDEDTLLIDESESLTNISQKLLYECVHAVQDVRDKNGNLQRLGLYNFSPLSADSIALNEVAIQYIVARVFEVPNKETTKFDVIANTYDEITYPLICNIMKQLIFVIGEKTLIKSTIYGQEDFVIDGYDAIGRNNFVSIEHNLDKMLYLEEEISYILSQDKTDEVEERQKKIVDFYIDCQKIILKVYFDRLFNRIDMLIDISYFRAKIEEFEKLIGYKKNPSNPEEDMKEYYKKYKEDKYQKILIKEAEIKRKNNLALTVVSGNVIIQMFRKIRHLASRIFKKV